MFKTLRTDFMLLNISVATSTVPIIVILNLNVSNQNRICIFGALLLYLHAEFLVPFGGRVLKRSEKKKKKVVEKDTSTHILYHFKCFKS